MLCYSYTYKRSLRACRKPTYHERSYKEVKEGDKQMDQQQQGQSSNPGSYGLGTSPLANELRDKLTILNSSQEQFGDIIIAKVRHLTRNVDNSEYDPDYVSIGPYHYPRPLNKNLHLSLEHDKLASLDKILSAAKPGVNMEVYVNELTRLELKARGCYANSFDDMTSEQFVRMLLLDGCYILCRLVELQAQPRNHMASPSWCTASNASFGSLPGSPASGAIITSLSVSTANGAGITSPSASISRHVEALEVVRDVFYLAENQIPFFVIEKIGDLTALDGWDHAIDGIAEYALNLMRMQSYAMAAPIMVPPIPAVPGNLLHLLHMHLKPVAVPSPGSYHGSVSVGRWRTATEYNWAGMKFKSQSMSGNGDVRCILDVKLDRGGSTLEVPCLEIDNETWRLLRNLMELEQRNGETVGTHVTAYCVFMSQMACTAKDVELLSRKCVIKHNHRNNDEVAECFGDLCKGILFNPNNKATNYLWETCLKLDMRSRSRSHIRQVYFRRSMVWLGQKYFSNPWLLIGLLAGITGLVCAVVQAVYTVLSYKAQG
uniref:Uncharacterized protein n=2 Tax=Hordeum vulgare subsp. vulgare TaxID=112509 RepID=A0A8I6X803_HORVV